MSTLVIAAHPDDELLGIGGTILKRISDGIDVDVVIACDCQSPRNDLKTIERVRKTSQKIAAKMGVRKLLQLQLGTEEDQRLDEIPYKAIVRHIERVVEEFRPLEIFTHNPNDWNTDHKVLFDATISATRTIRNTSVKRIYAFETPSSTEQAPNLPGYAFIPNKFVSIEGFLNRKLDLLSLYESELFPFPHMRSLDAIDLNARLWGAKNGLNAAEAFLVIRDIEGE